MESKRFTTDDGVSLHYVESYSGHDKQDILILLPGWSQTTKLFASQLQFFSPKHRVVALDPRGHGESENPESGYRLSRMAKDVWNLLDHLKALKVSMLCHSASCAVLWNFIELFGQQRLESIILVDQFICHLRFPHFSEQECLTYGSLATGDEMLKFIAKLAGPKGEAETRVFVRGMFSDKLSDEGYENILTDNLKFPRPAAAKMAWSVISADFRDILPTIAVPALCIGGAESHIPPDCIHWMASQMKNAKAAILPGTHFMFYEEPEPFNLVVREFLQTVQNQ